MGIERYNEVRAKESNKKFLNILKKEKVIYSINNLSNQIEDLSYGSVWKAVKRLSNNKDIIVEKFIDDNNRKKTMIFIDEVSRIEFFASKGYDVEIIGWTSKVKFGSIRFMNKLKQIIRDDVKKMREGILKRDKHKCQLCEEEKLEIHHIIAVDDYIGFYFGQLDKNNVLESVKFLKQQSLSVINNPVNLVTLCSECHDGLIPQYKFKLVGIAEKNTKGSKPATIDKFLRG